MICSCRLAQRAGGSGEKASVDETRCEMMLWRVFDGTVPREVCALPRPPCRTKARMLAAFTCLILTLSADALAGSDLTWDAAAASIRTHLASENARRASQYRSCTLSAHEDCAISRMPADETTVVLPGGGTRCISTKNAYGFQVIPGHIDSCSSTSRAVVRVGTAPRPPRRCAPRTRIRWDSRACSRAPTARTPFARTR